MEPLNQWDNSPTSLNDLLTCTDCGAVIHPTYRFEHRAFHRDVDERLDATDNALAEHVDDESRHRQ